MYAPQELQRQGEADIVVGLAGNKLDLVSGGHRKVSTEVGDFVRKKTTSIVLMTVSQEAKQYASENGCLYFETSAKSGENIVTIFRAIGNLHGCRDVSARPEVALAV